MTRAGPKASLGILVAISALQPIALNILAPATPVLARVFDASYSTVQLTLTLFLVSVALTQFAIGPLSDRFGRRPCVLAGILVFVAGSVLGAFAGNIGTLLLARVLEGAGAGTCFALARAIIRDTAGRDEAAKMIASVTMVMVVAPMLSPYLGGQIAFQIGWRGTFAAMAIVAVIVLVLTILRLPETAPDVGKRTSILGVFSAFPQLARSRAFVANVLALSFSAGAFFAFIAAAPFVVVEAMGRTSDVYGAFFMLNAAGYMVGNFAMARLVVRHGTGRMVKIGLMISLVALTAAVALSISESWTPLTLFVPTALNAIGNGMTIPGTTAAALSARPELAGAAAGLSGGIQLGSGAAITVFASWLIPLWPEALPLLMWAMTLMALVALLRLRSGTPAA